MSRSTFPVVTHVALFRQGRVFLLRRAQTGFLDGFFTLPGGHQQADEGVTEAAAREVREETGVRVRRLAPLAVMPYRYGVERGVNFVFQALDYDGVPEIGEPDLFDEAAWALPTDLPRPRPDWLPRAFALAAGGTWFHEFV